MNELRARVIAQEKGLYKISNGTEVRTAVVSGKYRYGVKTVSDYPAVGDYVIAEWHEGDGNAVITGLFPRRSCFIRKAAGTGKDGNGETRREKAIQHNVMLPFTSEKQNITGKPLCLPHNILNGENLKRYCRRKEAEQR